MLWTIFVILLVLWLVGIVGATVRVRMKGACAGCPNSVLDLRNVVEKVVCAVPGVGSVVNTF